MKNLFNKKNGVTLTELLVSTILIGIVMIGIVGFNFAIKDFQEKSDKASSAAIKAASALSFLRKDAELAVGNALDSGVLIFYDTPSAPRSTICFRHDSTNNIPNNTPKDYTDDEWFCTTHGHSFDLHRCGPLAAPSPNCTLSGSAVDIPIIKLVHSSDAAYKGDFFNAPGACGDCSNPGDENHMDYIEINIHTAYKAGNGAPAVNPVSNPDYFLTTRVNPSGHSR
ncbi:MAG: prepilin-type N-terminal cleavage/methylation domain-containing protein [Candidatus Omnitrophica bacterium]|nr:prepilin-type N-terminal cleavage/methylation domain-containing protein [Candidatus Omnitrophota bacterium]MCB9748243.1 prepilin-type N-terminal cleavage/methylation domain-containing protein [Candidatus Omnitrophota bacterium]